MKQNISIALNIVLIIAVGVLYFLHFKSNSSSVDTSADEPELKLTAKDFALPSSAAANAPIAYINIDTLNSQYKYISVLEARLKNKYKSKQSELEREAQSLQQEYAMFAEQVQKGMYTEQRAMEKDEYYKKKQYELMQKEQKVSVELQQEEVDLHDEILSRLSTFLKKYNKAINYSYVLAYGKESPVLFANDSLDITNVVLKGLNAEKLK